MKTTSKKDGEVTKDHKRSSGLKRKDITKTKRLRKKTHMEMLFVVYGFMKDMKTVLEHEIYKQEEDNYYQLSTYYNFLTYY